MSPADRETLLKKLTYLRRTLERLHTQRKLTEEQFLADTMLQSAVERLLQTALESVFDSARLLVTIYNLRNTKDAREAIEILGLKGLLPEELVSHLTEAKKFRNVLVHVYADVDPHIVYRQLMDGFPDLEWFSRCLAQHLKVEE